MASQPVQSYMQQAFQSTDYILPPSSNNTCRLKKYAFPPGSPVHSDPPTLTAHDEELNRRINKRPCPAYENDPSIPEKKKQDVPQVMNYTQNYSKKYVHYSKN